MRRVFLAVCLILSLLLVASNCFAAEPPWPIKSKTFTTSTYDDSTLTADVLIYGIKCYANANNSTVTLYDATSGADCTDANVVDEEGAAAQYNSSATFYLEPIKLVNGACVVLAAGYGTIYYRD